MAQNTAQHFWRRHSALRVCRLRPVRTIGEYARKRTRACGRRRLRAELVRTAVRSRQGFAAARAQARLRGCRRKAAGVAGAAGDGSACRHASGFVGFRRILPGRRKVLRKIRRAGGFAAFCLAGVKGLLLFRCVPAARVPGSLSAETRGCKSASWRWRRKTAQKNQSAPWIQKGAARRAIQGCFVPLGPRFGRLRAASAAEERFPAGKRALF